MKIILAILIFSIGVLCGIAIASIAMMASKEDDRWDYNDDDGWDLK